MSIIKKLAYLGYCVCLALAVYNVAANFFTGARRQLLYVVITLALFAVSAAIHYISRQDSAQKRRILYGSAMALFCYYISLLFLLLFMDGFIINRYNSSLNLTPFATIGEYLKDRHLFTALGNLAGNFLLFMPMGFFLPVLFKPFKRWYVYAPAMLVMIICVEAAQYLAKTGSADIDDVILNFAGALFAYIIVRIAMRIPQRRRFLKAIESENSAP